jgi:signal transduction histidine kinase
VPGPRSISFALTGFAVGAAVSGVHLVGRAAGWPGVAVLGFAEQAAILLALVVSLLASVRGPEDLRRSWRFVSAGLALTVTASTISAVYGAVTGARPVSPALTDIVYFGAYPFYLAAVFALPRRPQRLGLRDLLDGGAAGLLIALAVAAHVVTPIATSAGSGWNIAVNLGLAVADMALLWSVVAVLLTTRGLRVPWVGILAGGLAVLVTGDLAFLSLAAAGPVESSSPVFLVFLWGFLIVSYAAHLAARSGPWVPREPGEEASPWERASFHVLPLFILLGVTVLVGLEALSEDPRPFVVLGGLGIALLQAFRQFLTLRENRSLLAREREVVYRLRELDRMRADFMAVVSHDFANPLTVIGGMAAILRTRGERVSETDRLDMLNAIEQEAGRLADLARDVLTAVRAEHGELSYTFELVDVGTIADRCTRLVGQLSAVHEVAFERSGDTVVQADEARLQEVLLNLLDNAIKYSPEGGRVVVRVRGETAIVRVEIEDQGVGLTSEEAARVFDRMVRIRNASTRDIKGTGLGLYIVRRIVQAHGGRIRAEGRPGRGSVFTIELPREQPRDRRPAPRSEAEPVGEAETAG